jgi:hypothetical protein
MNNRPDQINRFPDRPIEDRKSDTPFARGHLDPRYVTAEGG